MKKIIFSLLMVVNLWSISIQIVVDKEPITDYDISVTMKKFNLDKNQAIKILINDKLELSAMKQFNISISKSELDSAIASMLAQNNSTLTELKNTLKAQNQTLEQFEQKFKHDLEKRKLYDYIANSAKIDYSDEGTRKYFQDNQNKFTLFTQINADLYVSSSANLLENFKQFRKTKIIPKNVTLTPNNADIRLLSLLSSININELSPVLRSENSYTIYKIRAKTQAQIPNFSDVKDEVFNDYINEQKQNAIEDYFEKLKSRIDIRYLSNF